MEKNIGVTLFYRTNHYVELTDAGKTFLKEAYDIMQHIDNAIEKAIKAEKGTRGELIIGFSSNSMYDVLPKTLKAFNRNYPSINVKVQQMSTSEQVKALNNEEIQIGILCPPIDQTNLYIKHIFEQNVIAVLPESHSLNNRNNFVNVEDLNNDNYIMPPRRIGPGYYDNIVNICFDAGYSPNIIQEAVDLHTCVSLVSTGMGVALVPKSLEQYQKEGVVFKNINVNKTIKTAIAWKPENTTNIIKNFLKVINEIYKAT